MLYFIVYIYILYDVTILRAVRQRYKYLFIVGFTNLTLAIFIQYIEMIIRTRFQYEN